jgi:hypothetical protein
MDPVTLALVTAAASGAVSGSIGEPAAALYGQLKKMVARALGREKDVMNPLDELETLDDPISFSERLEHAIASAQIDQDPEILPTARRLLEAIRNKPAISSQFAYGHYIAQAQSKGTASVTVSPKRQEERNEKE